MRGITALEVVVTSPSRDVHSGIYGGSLENPAMALCQLLAKLRTDDGRVNIPGFYDDVQDLTPYERKQLARLPMDEEEYREFLGVPQLFGERGYSPIEQRSARPTLEINGLTSGYQGEGSKTIIPAWARAKLTMRLVPNQKPEKIQQLVSKHIKKLCPPTVKVTIKPGHGGEPYIVSPDSPLAQGALRALKKAFGYEPVLMREGGSIPIVTEFKNILGRGHISAGPRPAGRQPPFPQREVQPGHLPQRHAHERLPLAGTRQILTGDNRENGESEDQAGYWLAPGRISRLSPSVTFISWKLMSNPTGTLSSFM